MASRGMGRRNAGENRKQLVYHLVRDLNRLSRARINRAWRALPVGVRRRDDRFRDQRFGDRGLWEHQRAGWPTLPDTSRSSSRNWLAAFFSRHREVTRDGGRGSHNSRYRPVQQFHQASVDEKVLCRHGFRLSVQEKAFKQIPRPVPACRTHVRLQNGSGNWTVSSEERHLRRRSSSSSGSNSWLQLLSRLRRRSCATNSPGPGRGRISGTNVLLPQSCRTETNQFGVTNRKQLGLCLPAFCTLIRSD